jgi:hypothetical protein
MEQDTDRIAKLEWANYAAQRPAIQATLGINLVMDEKRTVLTGLLPSPDVNHACLLRTMSRDIDNLITDIIRQFRWNVMPPRIFVSPACAPHDLEAHLMARGFIKQEEENEAWMTLDLKTCTLPNSSPDVQIQKITKHDTRTFSRVFTSAFDLPGSFAPFLTYLLRPSIELPGYHHYLASVNERPLGICSMIYYDSFGILGSVGVVPQNRGGRTAASLLIESIKEARDAGIDTIMLQTASNSPIVRRLRLAGFQVAFNRFCYILQ